MTISIDNYLPEYFKETADDIHKRMIDEAPKDISTIEGDIFWSTTRPCAEEIAKAKKVALLQVLKLGIVQTATGKFLDLKGEADGIPRKSGEASIQKILFVGVEGTIISAGRKVSTVADEDNEAIEFLILKTVTIDSTGIATTVAECLKTGKLGNVAQGKITVLTKNLNGIKRITNTEIVKDGVDDESDEDYLYRILENAQNPPTSGNIAHYKKWSKECIGVKSCKVVSLWDKNNGRDGNGTVKVIIVADENKAASDELIKYVKNHLDPYPEGEGRGQAPIGSTVTVVSCIEKEIDITANVILMTGYTKDIVQNNFKKVLSQYLSELSFDSTTYISLARIGNVLLDTDGVVDYSDLKLNGSAENANLSNEEIAVTGTVEIEVVL
ncbi:baseplate J/gp47 family protein [Clostridium butyricum]|uniref:baseplate J/gp47 family protein n=1 Tax=Clostridium butyricum TaxID=1492 RepID=UPI0006E4F104|nr:hypothetical protein AK964_17820 [Clostridium butyricum]